MNWSVIRKRLQKQSFDLLAQRHGLLIIFVAVVVIFVALVNFGESVTTWSAEKYAAVVNSFDDNVVGQSFRGRLCLPIPVDIVYTWVNGSDPRLLKELQHYKETMLHNVKTTQETTDISVCKYDNCVSANGIVIAPPVPSKISLKHLGLLYPSFKNAERLIGSIDPITGHNVSLVLFKSQEVAESSLKQPVIIQGKTAAIHRLFYTTEKALPNTVLASNVATMIGFPDELNNEQLLQSFSQEHRIGIVHLTVHKDRGIAILTMSDHTAFASLLDSKNISISGKSPTFKETSFVWDLTDYRYSEDISASRFEDNDELRYSLRSVEKHAPWVRHIFIVTNGQIPSWLNLDDERVTVVSHSDIFLNKSHLPTFSSPAIESHLHRIPGLSKWFIYMNDDVLFGRDVWPDDFVSASGAQKVYLTWPVPNCNDGCPASWISDGYCDRACNNSQCEWDGGDCVGGGARAHYPFYGISGGGNSAHLPRSGDLYCNQGCANNWIADRYCDQSCNVRACGFDAADCGTASFSQLRGIKLHENVKFYDAKGTDIVYFNLSTVIGESGYVYSSTFSQDPIVRSASVSRKFQVLTVVMYHNETERTLNFSLSVKNAVGRNVTYNFTLTVDTHLAQDDSAINAKQETSHPPDRTKVAETELVELFTFMSGVSRKFPKPKYHYKSDTNLWQVTVSENMTEHDIGLPAAAQNEYKSLLSQYSSGDLTQTGFNILLAALMKNYSQPNEMKSEIRPAMSKKQLKPGNLLHAVAHNATHFYHTKTKIRDGSQSYVYDKKDKLPGRHLNYIQNSAETAEEDEADTDGETYHSLQSQWAAAHKRAGFLPWEQLGIFSKMTFQVQRRENPYKTNNTAGKRRLLDTYADSLRHVSRIYNRAYGYTARRVPGHMPHMINRNIAARMQEKFAEEWDMTSSHQMRCSNDMQFAFSYFYFLLSEPLNSSIDDLFAEVDVDKSGVLSDRELRILATRIYDLPIDLQTLEGLERTIINCSRQNATSVLAAEQIPSKQEVYFDKRMPQVTMELIKSCPLITEAFQKQVKSRTKYKFEVVGEDDITFKMLNANVTRVVAILDEIRQKPQKFICLNDNIDYEQASAKTVKVVLHDFYESFFPKPSRFELPAEYRNRYLHVDELREWWHYRTWLQRFTVGCFSVAVMFALVSFYSDRMYSLRRRWSRH